MDEIWTMNDYLDLKEYIESRAHRLMEEKNKKW